jgi:GNAT superfamily N-acetyltransferase
VTTIRAATPADVPNLHALICELAAFERAPDAVVATTDDLHRALFVGAEPSTRTPHGTPAAYALVIDDPQTPGELAAFALYFLTYSTWLGRHGIYLEDLYVRPQFRGHGCGTSLLVELAKIAIDRGYGRLEWSVLDWNTPAWDFYSKLGAGPMSDWTVHRVAGPELIALAALATSALPPDQERGTR